MLNAARDEPIGREPFGRELRVERLRAERLGRVESGNGQPGYDGKRESGFAELKRVEVPSLLINERVNGFAEVELYYSDEQIKAETHRCRQCDLEICLAKEKRTEELGR